MPALRINALPKAGNDSSETSVPIYETTRRHIPEDCNIDLDLCSENSSYHGGIKGTVF
jgi:hypothetical protein